MNLSRMFQSRWIATVLLLFAAGSQAQDYDHAKRFAAGHLREDFALLRRALETTHPGLYRYASQAETDALFERISASLNRPLTEREFYKQVALLSSVIRCGHTRIRRSEAFYKDRNTRDKYLPLRLVFLDGHSFVRYNLSGNPEVAPGTRILRLNGRALSSLVEQMMPYLPGDGTNVSAVEGYPYPSRGIIPHYRVEPTIGDLISGRDPVMDFALSKIRIRK